MQNECAIWARICLYAKEMNLHSDLVETIQALQDQSHSEKRKLTGGLNYSQYDK